jgi:class 3 adenylate cyclase/tetratricopeptide (TPR) repeat protein
MHFCGVCGAALATPGVRARRDGDGDQAERRHITVMFCDVVDSTSLSERLDPEDFREVLSGYQAACASAIERFEGYVARWIGDGMLAYFGYPRAHEDDARRAVHAALGIIEEIGSLNGRLREAFDVSIQVRVGLHAGLVVAGEMGAGSARDPLAIVGETPHIAARLQALASPGSAVMSDAILQLVAHQFHSEPLGTHALKGISRPVEVHRVLRPLAETAASGPLDARSSTPLTDRSAERSRLSEAWQRATHGEGVVVHLLGEAGIGKSRLIGALREQVRGEEITETVLRCSPDHARTTLYPAVRFLERLLGPDSKPASQQLQGLKQLVAESGLDAGEAVPLLADLLSISVSPEQQQTLMPRDARNATLRILQALLMGNGTRQPLLLVVEDVQWADPTTIELLERCVAGIAGAAVACILSFRLEFEPPWARGEQVVEIELGPLQPDDVRAMASAASREPLDADVLKHVESAADGVPLYIEEMVKALAAGQRGVHGGALTSAVPPTLHGLLAERLDRLPQLREVIDVAAVLGREFERGLLQVLSAPEAAAFTSALSQLVAEDVLQPVEGSRSRLEFKHALLQEAAYERLLRSRRRALHERVAGVLTSPTAVTLESEPERVAYHWSRAGQPAKAMAYWELAGRRALKRAAFLEAAEHFDSALEALDEARPGPEADLERGDLLTDIGAALQAGRTPAAEVAPTYAKARTAYERAGRRERVIPVIRGQWLFHLIRAEYEPALALGAEMLTMGEHAGRPTWLAEGYLYRGLAHMYRGEFEPARAELEQAYQRHARPERPDHIYAAQGDTGVAALAYVASVLFNQGRAQESSERSEESLRLADEVGGPVTLAQTWGMRAALLLTRGELAQLGPWLERTHAHCAQRNIGYWRTVCSLWSAWLQGRSGRLELGIARLQEELVAYFAAGSRLSVAHFYILLADLRLAAGDRRRALDALRSGQEHIEVTGERFAECDLHMFRGRALMSGAEPDATAATAAFERAAEVAREQDAALLELRAATYLASHQLQVREPPTALARVETLCRWFGPDSRIPDVLRARALVGDEATLL